MRFQNLSFEIWLYFVVIIAEWTLPIQVRSAVLSMTGDDSMVHDLCRAATADLVLLSYV